MEFLFKWINFLSQHKIIKFNIVNQVCESDNLVTTNSFFTLKFIHLFKGSFIQFFPSESLLKFSLDLGVS
jgi:hypothetical protein